MYNDDDELLRLSVNKIYRIEIETTQKSRRSLEKTFANFYIYYVILSDYKK